MSNTIIRATLINKLRTWADAQVPKIPIAYENASFTKPLTGGFLQPTLVPNLTMSHELSGVRQTMLGIFEILCWYPSTKGMVGADALSDSVNALFQLLPKIGNVHMQNINHTSRPMLDDSGWIVVSVTIPYRYETVN